MIVLSRPTRRPGQPDRRAHRLQRRLRPANADPAAHRAELAPRDDRIVRAYSANIGGEVGSFTLGEEKPGRGWLDYVQGATTILRDDGHPLDGFDVLVQSEVPLGSGLSSSASLSVSLIRALRAAFGLSLDDQTIAVLARRVENQFVGAQVGIMDPMACSLAQPGEALFLDARSLATERVPLPAKVELVVINSGVAHDHAAGDYNTRRAECEQACALLGVQLLRDSGRGRPAARRSAARAAAPAGPARRHRERPRAARRRGDARRRPAAARRAVLRSRTPRCATITRCRCRRSI